MGESRNFCNTVMVNYCFCGTLRFISVVWCSKVHSLQVMEISLPTLQEWKKSHPRTSSFEYFMQDIVVLTPVLLKMQV